jgi:competence protein ComEA
MTDEERRAWMRTLVLLAAVAAARWGWAHRPGGAAVGGSERDVAAAMDTVQALRAEEDRRARPLASGETLDPNRADIIDLDRLPGVGPATAEAIVAARSDAPFVTVDDLLEVRGIGPTTLAEIGPHLRIPPGSVGAARVRGPVGTSRIDVNRAGRAELEALPGIGPALSERILQDREETGPYGRVEDLLRVRGIGPATLDRIRPLIRVR